MGDRDAFTRELEREAAADLRLEAEPRHVVAQLLQLLRVPVLGKVPRGVEAGIVVEQADPERRQRRQPRPRTAVHPAHLEVALETHLGENRRHVVRPVGQGRALARQARKPALEQIAKRLPGHIDVLVAALDEVHRHVERIVDPALETHAGLERPGQHAAAVGIGVAPDFRAEREKAVWLSFGEGRVREQCRRYRLERQRDAQLLHHVGFRREVEVRLHRAGAVHHVEAEPAHLRHVGRHDAIAALRHHRHLGALPVGRHADTEKSDAERTRDFAQLRKVGHQLGAGLMHGLDRRARELELAAGLERDRAAAGHVGKADDVRPLHDRVPAEQHLHPLEQPADAAAALVGHRLVTLDREGEFFVLGADAELRRRLGSLGEPRNEVVARLHRRHVDLIAGHAAFRRQKGGDLTHGAQ